MDGSDPTHAVRRIRVDIPSLDRAFLKELITMSRDGVREELTGLGQSEYAPHPLRREEAAYERLLVGLHGGELEADADVRAALAQLGEVVDTSNEYARVVFEHRALQRLIAIAGRDL